jgi:Tfp pilus assembly PilM family ATPase
VLELLKSGASAEARTQETSMTPLQAARLGENQQIITHLEQLAAKGFFRKRHESQASAVCERQATFKKIHLANTYSQDELKTATAAELRRICQEEGVDDSGLVWQMRNRLMDHFEYM